MEPNRRWTQQPIEMEEMEERRVEYMSLMTPTKQFTMQICRSFSIFFSCACVYLSRFYTLFEAHLFGTVTNKKKGEKEWE